MPQRLRSLFFNIALLFLTLILLIGTLEWFLRFSGIQRLESRRPHLHQRTSIPGVHYEFIPNLRNARGYNWERISTNTLGFRGGEIDPTKPTIVLIGDSFAFGFGVNDDETHARHLERAFPDHNVLNTGVNGYNVEQEVRAYLAKFPDLRPALVIVEFVFNDAKQASIMTEDTVPEVHDLDGLAGKYSADEELRASIDRPGTLRIPFKFWLTKRSAIFNFLEKRTKWLPFRAHPGNRVAETFTKRDLAFYEEWLRKLAEHPPVRSARKLFVIWPEPSLHLESRRMLREMAQRHGFLILDLYDLFGMTYSSLSWDWHPNASSHRTAGELMADVIREYRLLEGWNP